MFERAQQWSGVVLRQRQRAGACHRIRQYRMMAMTQSIRRHSCRGAEASDEVVFSIRAAQQLALRLDDSLDQRMVVVAGASLRRRKHVERNADDAHLIWHQPKNPGDFVSVSGRNSLKAQIASIGIEIQQWWKGHASFNVKSQKAWKLPHALHRIVPRIETTGDRLITDRPHRERTL